MPVSSFGIAVAPKRPDRMLTGPMTLALLTLLACAITRASGLDQAGVSFCYFKALTGHACFTCGTTRAIGHLARFDFPSAFVVQPLVTALALVLLFWGAADGALLPASRRTVVRVEDRTLRAITVFGVVLATLNWIYLLAVGV